MEQLPRWRNMARAMCSPCRRSASDGPGSGKRRSGKRRSGKPQKPVAINALRRDIAISTAMGLNRVVCIDRVAASYGGPIDRSRLRYGNYRLSSDFRTRATGLGENFMSEILPGATCIRGAWL